MPPKHGQVAAPWPEWRLQLVVSCLPVAVHVLGFPTRPAFIRSRPSVEPPQPPYKFNILGIAPVPFRSSQYKLQWVVQRVYLQDDMAASMSILAYLEPKS